MPAWGLTADQRRTEPWGLPEELLEPGKVITDPVHGDIHLTRLEQYVLDSPPFQRLRRIRQLGMTHLVYPGATHTRFSHSLGALRVSQDLLDAVIGHREGLHAAYDRFAQLFTEERDRLDAEIARATVLTRLGALLHDISHVPFGHSVEDDLNALTEHDKNEERFDEFWRQVNDYVSTRGRQLAEEMAERNGRDPEAATVAMAGALNTLLERRGALHRELRPLILSKTKTAQTRTHAYPFAADLVGNTICADLLDYLMRDHLFTGLPAKLGRRFLSAFYVIPRGREPYGERVALNIVREDGQERLDIVTELLKALRFRYELSERALVHHAKLSADAMVGKALELWSEAIWVEVAAEELRQIVDGDLGPHARVPLLQAAIRKEFGSERARELEQDVEEELEAVFRASGDDGLLEFMSELRDEEPNDPVAELAADRMQKVRRLARDLLRRNLFAVGGRVSSGSAPAEELYESYGRADRRSALERDAERWAEVTDWPRVVIWLPESNMRLKFAEVLVDYGGGVMPFVEYERHRSGRGSEIYDAHARLWSLWVFVDRSVDDFGRDVMLTYLAQRLGVCWQRDVPRFGRHPHEWPDRLAASRVLDTDPSTREVDDLLKQGPSVAARGEITTFRELEATYEALA